MKILTELLESFELDANTSVSRLRERYEQLILKNVPIPDDLGVKVEKKILEFDFSTKNVKPENDEFKVFKYVKEHLDFTCEMINTFLLKYFEKEFDIDLEFLFRARYIAQNLSVLKRRMDYTYEILPWEEMQFCLVIYLYCSTKSAETNIIYKLLLDRNRILKYLFHFYGKITEVRHNFKEEYLKLKKSINRNLIKNNIIKQVPYFKELYIDFSLLRDVYSLNKIKIYLDQALSINLCQDKIIGQLVIERTMQVMGEYLKNTVDSPNLSDDTYKILMKSAPRNLRIILANVRNMLSHAFSLTRKLELEESNDASFFKNIQNDLQKVHDEIVYILYQQQIKAIKLFLIKILNQDSLVDIQFVFKEINIGKIEINADAYSSNPQSFSQVRELIEKFCQEILEQLPEQSNLIKEIKDSFQSYITKTNDSSLAYIEGINKLFNLERNNDDLSTIHNIARTYLSTLPDSEPQSLFNQVFKKLHKVYETFKKRRNYDVNNFLKPDDEAIKLGNIVIDIYNNLKWGMRKIKWIEETEKKLTPKIDINEEKIQKINIFFKAVEEKLEDTEEKTIIQNAIIQKIKQHSNKSKLVDMSDVDIENFKSIVKSLNLSAKREKELHYNFEKKKLDRLNLLVKEINDDYGTLIKQLGDLFPRNKYILSLVTFYNSLKVKKPLQTKITKVVHDVVQEEVTYSYQKRLEILEKILKNISYQTIKENKYLITAVEMLVLDLTEYLENVKLLGDNKLFLIESLPILKGKQLRNYLAHGDILTEILPHDPLNSIIFYAEKLVDMGKNILAQNIQLGYAMNYNNNLEQHYGNCLDTVKIQKSLFDFVKNNYYDKVCEIIKTGADLNGISVYGQTIADFAIYGGNLELLKYFLENSENSTEVIYNYFKTAIISGQFTIMKYIINKFKIDINHKHQDNITPLHLALQSGHSRLAKWLLENGADMNKKTINGKIAFLFALESKNKELVLSWVDNNPEVIDVCINNNIATTVLHLAVQNDYPEIVQLLLNKNASSCTETINSLNAFELSVIHGHEDILKIFFKTLKLHLPYKLLIRLVFLATESGYLSIVWPLLKHYININAKNSDGETVLHRSALYGQKKDVVMLVENGIDIESEDNNGRRALHLACRCGHVEIINILLENKANINVEDKNKTTPLHWAVENGYQNVVKLLLSNNAKVDTCDNNGKTALHLAAENYNLDIFTILLTKTDNANVRTNDGKSPLHLAAENGHSEILGVLLNTPHIDINVKTENDETPLILATVNGHFNIVEQLLKHGSHLNDKSREEGYTALTRAAEQGYTDIVTILIKNKADIETEEKSGWRALHFAVQNGYLDILEILCKNGVNVNAKYANNGTALLTATRNGHTEIVEKLINFGADINSMMISLLPLRVAAHFGHKDILLMLLKQGANVDACGNDAVTPLHTASWRGHTEIVKLLLKNGANVNCKTEELWTALHFAAKFGYYEIVALLVERGVDINSKNNFGTTAFHISCEVGYDNIVSMLLKTDQVYIDDKNTNGWTSLHWASANGHIKVVDILIKHNATINIKANDDSTPLHWAAQYAGSIDVVNALVLNKADINATDAKGSTPLHLASLKGNVKVVQALLQNNADANAENNKVTALHLAANFGHYEIMQALLEKGLDVNARGLHLKTALHLAAEQGHTEIVEILLKKGADVNIPDELNKTSLHLAVERGHENIVKKLIQNHSNLNLKDNFGNTPLHLAIYNNHENIIALLLANNAYREKETYDNFPILHFAVKRGLINVVSTLINQNVNLDAMCRTNEYTPLREAIYNDQEDIAMLLLENKANVNVATSRGWTALHVAAGKGKGKIFNYLIKAGANINAKTADRETPLFFASLQGHYDIVVDILKNDVDVNIQTKSKGLTALSAAAKEGHAEIISLLIKYKADVNLEESQHHLTPLHLSALYGHEISVKILLSHSANMNSKTKNNMTALHLAASEGYANIVKLLLEKSLDNINDKTEEEQTPLLLAVEKGHIDVVQELLKHNANITIHGKNGLTPIQMAVQKGFSNIVEILMEQHC